MKSYYDTQELVLVHIFFKQSQETIQNNKEKYEPCIYEPPIHTEYFALRF